MKLTKALISRFTNYLATIDLFEDILIRGEKIHLFPKLFS